jgi:hypothetical protein
MFATVTTTTTTYTVEVKTDRMARDWRRQGVTYMEKAEIASKLEMHRATIAYAHAVIRDLSVWKQYTTSFEKPTPKTDEYILRAAELLANAQLALEREAAAQKAAEEDALILNIKQEFEQLNM